MERYKKNIESRLVRRLDVDAQTGCWAYRGFKPNGGGFKGQGRQYPVMGVTIPGRTRRLALVHRVAAWLWLGVELDGPHEVLHDCDNKTCCNPNPGHIRVGTRSENMKDAYKRGLQPRGGRSGRINFRKAEQIRKLYATGKYTQQRLARAAGIPQQQISLIINNKAWVKGAD